MRLFLRSTFMRFVEVVSSDDDFDHQFLKLTFRSCLISLYYLTVKSHVHSITSVSDTDSYSLSPYFIDCLFLFTFNLTVMSSSSAFLCIPGPWTQTHSVILFCVLYFKYSSPMQSTHYFSKQSERLSTPQFNTTRSISAQDTNQKLVNTMLPNIVELTAATLSTAPDDTTLRKTAVLLLSACTLMNKVHREFAFQVTALRQDYSLMVFTAFSFLIILAFILFSTFFSFFSLHFCFMNNTQLRILFYFYFYNHQFT